MSVTFLTNVDREEINKDISTLSSTNINLTKILLSKKDALIVI